MQQQQQQHSQWEEVSILQKQQMLLQQQQQVDAQANIQRRAPSMHTAGLGIQAAKKQQRGKLTPEPASVDEASSGDYYSHPVTLLDTLAVAAAVASEDPSVMEQPLGAAYRQATPAAAAAAAPPAAAAAGAGGGGAGGRQPPVLVAAASSSEQALLQAARTHAARPTATASAAAVAVAAEAADSPSGSTGSASRDPISSTLNAIAAEARGGGPYRKSCMLDLADQLGAAAAATAQAAAEAGQPLSYEAVMQLMQPFEERVCEDKGMPLQAMKGWDLDEVRKVCQHGRRQHCAEHAWPVMQPSVGGWKLCRLGCH
jgi:hypothetical protein